MAKEKEKKTNAMRILDSKHVDYIVHTYECDEFIDGIESTKKVGMPLEQSFKTLVTLGKSGEHYVFVLPVDKEVDLKKAAKAVGEKSVEMIHVKEILKLTGYIRGGVSPLGMKKVYPTIFHESAENFESILISGGKIGCSIEVNPQKLETALSFEYKDILSV